MEALMIVVNLLVDLYHLLERAVVIALNDPAFEADWSRFEADLAALGIDIPGAPAPTSPSPSPAQVAPSAEAAPAVVRQFNGEEVVRNADGTISLKEV